MNNKILSFNKNKPSFQQGFTLLEVMIALTIFSIASSALILSDGQAIRQVSTVQEKVMASWLAESALNRLYVEKKIPQLGTTSNTKVLDKKSWYIQQEVVDSAYPSLRQVNVRVFLDQNTKRKKVIYQLTGFVRSTQQ